MSEALIVKIVAVCLLAGLMFFFGYHAPRPRD